MKRKILSVIQEQLGLDEEELTDDAELRNDLGMDSLDLVELVMALEHEFSISVEDPDGDKWRTVGDIVRYIEKRMVL